MFCQVIVECPPAESIETEQQQECKHRDSEYLTVISCHPLRSYSSISPCWSPLTPLHPFRSYRQCTRTIDCQWTQHNIFEHFEYVTIFENFQKHKFALISETVRDRVKRMKMFCQLSLLSAFYMFICALLFFIEMPIND